MTKEARERAGIAVIAVGGATVGSYLRAPGVVEANAYKRVAVTPLAAGRVTRVGPQLGERVSRGQTIAEIFSPDLATAQAGYVSARAELDAHDRELARVEKLVQLGSASRQELERVTAEHTSRRTAVQSVAARLRLLGVADDAMEHLGTGHTAPAATLQVRAPLSGVITERPANVGLNVDAATPLATIVDLSSVWVVADVYEADFGRVRVGMPATVTTAAFRGQQLAGRVSYIDPQVSPETRTAKVRIEVPNPRQELRLGMLAEARLGGVTGDAATITVPRRAVQTMGDRSVVYIVNRATEGGFLERTVLLGAASADAVVVMAGLEPGDVVVSEGSFYVRTERERLGLGDPAPVPAPPGGVVQGGAARNAAPQVAEITVTKDGFRPAKVSLRAGTLVRLTFLRTTDETCATEVVFTSLKTKRALPLNKPVHVEFTPEKTGSVEFACGMNMFKGAILID
jgi:cobalt-zinc-cadmium efflux system membrane fusion protein